MIHKVLSVPLMSMLPVLAAAPQSPAEVAQQTALEAAFQQLMTGCRMVGHFTDSNSDRPAQKDSYTIAKAEKVRDEKWRFDVKIEYQDKSASVPLVVDVFWADETPTIQVTRLPVPGLGTFDARVIIHGDRYAGMWSGADHGGHMYGKIVRAAAPQRTASGQDPQQQGTAAQWPSWRGSDGSGAVAASNPPTEWSEDKNIRWKTPLPGLGNSTPVVWRDRIYLTTAIETDQVGEAPAEPATDAPRGTDGGGGGDRGNRGGRGGRGGSNNPRPTKVFDFRVLALDRATGKVIWSTSVRQAVPHEGGHSTGSQASSSPITDGESIYAHFGSRGIYGLSLDGKIEWSKDLGLMRTRNQFGEGSSPALSGNTLIVNWDHEGDSFVVALDKRTGDEIWRQPRNEITSWTTPVIAEVDGRAQVIISATGASRAYDVETGEEIWSCTGMTTNAIPTPIVRDGVAYLMSGFRGAMLQAIELSGAKGDITDTEHVLWSHNRQTSYVPSALLYGDRIWFLRSNNAVLSCLDAKTGDVVYEGERLPGLRTVYASPIAAAGRIYLPSREGACKVITTGDTLEELATNQLDDMFDASPVVIGDVLYLRGHNALYCIAAK